MSFIIIIFCIYLSVNSLFYLHTFPLWMIVPCMNSSGKQLFDIWCMIFRLVHNLRMIKFRSFCSMRWKWKYILERNKTIDYLHSWDKSFFFSLFIWNVGNRKNALYILQQIKIKNHIISRLISYEIFLNRISSFLSIICWTIANNIRKQPVTNRQRQKATDQNTLGALNTERVSVKGIDLPIDTLVLIIPVRPTHEDKGTQGSTNNETKTRTSEAPACQTQKTVMQQEQQCQPCKKDLLRYVPMTTSMVHNAMGE